MRRKTPEELQAQAELFADKGVKEFSDDQRFLLSTSAELAQIEDLSNAPDRVKELVEQHRDAYVQFFRENRQLDNTSIIENNRLYQEKFAPVIAELKQRIGTGKGKELPEYLGSGSNGSAFRITVDGKEYAAKFSSSITQQNFERKPIERAKGIAHAAQLTCYSFQDQVVIMEMLTGKDVTSLKPEEMPLYPDEHVIQLIEKVKELDAKGIVIDPKPSNFMYDPKEGFSILDFHIKRGTHSNIETQLMWLRTVLAARDFGKPDYKDDEKMRLQSIEKYKVYLPTSIQFLRIMQEKYPELLSAWKKQHEENKNNPMMAVSDVINRESIPEHPDLKPYLDELTQMGY